MFLADASGYFLAAHRDTASDTTRVLGIWTALRRAGYDEDVGFDLGKRTMNLRLALAAASFVVLGSGPIAIAKVARNWNDLVPGPRVIRYDMDKDQFIHQDSIFSTVLKNHRPGGELSYSGNRLETFQYRGKRGTGGLYDALEDYKLKLDPKNYQYRRK